MKKIITSTLWCIISLDVIMILSYFAAPTTGFDFYSIMKFISGAVLVIGILITYKDNPVAFDLPSVHPYTRVGLEVKQVVDKIEKKTMPSAIEFKKGFNPVLIGFVALIGSFFLERLSLI